MARATRAAALLVFACCAVAAHAAIPEWAHAGEAVKLQSADPETNAVVLLDEVKYTILNDDELIERYRRVVKILHPQAQNQGDLRIWLQGRDKATAMHAWTLDAAGHEFEIKERDFAEDSPYSYGLYNDVRLIKASLGTTQPGSVVVYEYEARKHSLFHELDWTFQEESPVVQARFLLQLPNGWEYKNFWRSNNPVKEVASAEGGWEWTVEDVPGIKKERGMPPLAALSDRMELCYFSPGDAKSWTSWDAMGRWYSRLIEGRRDATPEITRQSGELTAGKHDFDAKVRALATFVQSQVRYVAIEIGIGGFQPHPAGDVFRLRYGDCKDKATLLSALLHEAGIESDYVVINTHRGVIVPEQPSRLFNHVILAIELPPSVSEEKYRSVIRAHSGKSLLIFDPTDEETPVGSLRTELQDNYALLVENGGGEVIHTPLAAPKFNELLREGHFVLSADLSLKGEILEKRSGDHASRERYWLRKANQQQRQQGEEKFLGRSLQGFTLDSLQFKDLENLENDLSIQAQITVPRYANLQGPLLLLRPRIVGEKAFAVENKPRKFPFELSGPSHEIDTFEIEIPQGYKVDDLPDGVKIDAGFASYTSKIELDGNKVRYTREFVVRDLSVPAERVAELRAFESRIGADEVAAVVLVKQ